MVNQLQFTNPQAYSGGADFSPLERLGYAWAAQQKEAQQNEEAYRLMGGGQGQPPQSGGFFQDIGRRFGLIPEQVPGAPPARATAEVPTSPRADGSGIGTMTPNAKSWFNFATRPVADGGLGLSQAQAAGKVANLQAESGANITPWGVAGDQGTAQGSAQWRGDRLRNLVEFSKANGMDYRTTEAQQAFMRHEYLGDPNAGAGGGSEGKAYAALSATRSPQEAATAVNRYYERSADKSGRREAGAARLNGSNVPSGTPVVAQGNMPSSAFSARPPLSAAMVDPNASPLDNAPWPQGNVGAPAPGAVAAGAPAPPLQTAAVPAAPVVASDAPEAKVVQNLVSGQPAAAAGVNREQLAQMYRNPITRPLATAILQKQLDPGSWSYHPTSDGTIIAANNRTNEVKVVYKSEDTAKDYTIEKRTRPDGTEEFVRIKKTGPEGPIGGGGAETPAIDPTITGDAFLSQLDPARANTVKSIAEGRQQPPSGFALKNPKVLALLRDVAQYEPGFDLTLWKSRNAMQTSATSGKIGQNIASFNTAIGHLGDLEKSINGLENTGFTPYNMAANWARAKYDPKFAGKIKDFESAKTAVVDELTRAFRGTGGNVHDLVAWEKNINAADSPEALRAVTKQVVALLDSRIEALGDQYQRGMQHTVPKDMHDLLSPKAKNTYQRLVTGTGETSAPAAAAAAAPPPANRVKGAVYPTPKGDLRWTGSGWVSP